MHGAPLMVPLRSDTLTSQRQDVRLMEGLGAAYIFLNALPPTPCRNASASTVLLELVATLLDQLMVELPRCWTREQQEINPVFGSISHEYAVVVRPAASEHWMSRHLIRWHHT